MMNIEEGNLIVKNVIYQNMTSNIKVLKAFDEFGFYKYSIFTEINQPGLFLINFKRSHIFWFQM
jgi:hypothetical protein